ncbi:MAG TPA: tetratricopeptide repeat protein, partial [Fimbriimonadaceae bacterium]|nr:tetratricopeptide repeat protein [Fimbriimonadaceae bacterium]
KFVDAMFDAAPKDPAQITKYVDAAVNADRFSDAINALDPIFKASPSRADLADRLAYCQMRAGRFEDGLITLETLKRVGANSSDAYAQALGALILDHQNKPDASDASMSDAELNDAFNPGVNTAQASIALRRNKLGTSQSIANSLLKDQGQRTEVNYLLSALSNHTLNFQQARHFFELSVLADPLNFDMYVEEANSAVKTAATAKPDDKTFQYAYAEVMCKLASRAKPDSYQALTALALVNGLQGKAADAYRYAQAAVDAQKGSAGAQFALSACASLYARAVRPRDLPKDDQGRTAYDKAVQAANRLDQLAVTSNEAAAKIDPTYAGGRSVPTIQEAFEYFSMHGRSPVIARPS